MQLCEWCAVRNIEKMKSKKKTLFLPENHFQLSSSFLPKKIYSLFFNPYTVGNPLPITFHDHQIKITISTGMVEAEIIISRALAEKLSKNKKRATKILQEAFTHEGLRHLLCMMRAHQWSLNKPCFEWLVNEVLELLGYTRAQKGGYKGAAKEKASLIMEILCNAEFTIWNNVKGNRNQGLPVMESEKLFHLDESSLVSGSSKMHPHYKRATLSLNPAWAHRETGEGYKAPSVPIPDRLLAERNRLGVTLLTILAAHFRTGVRFAKEGEGFGGQINIDTLHRWSGKLYGKRTDKFLEKVESALRELERKNYLLAAIPRACPSDRAPPRLKATWVIKLSESQQQLLRQVKETYKNLNPTLVEG